MARTDFDSSQLSPDGHSAYQTLLSATQFTIGPAGFGGFSKEEATLRTLLKEKMAAEACLSLVNDANYEGGLYGLLGLHLLRSDMFASAVEKYKSRPSPPERTLAGVKVPAGEIVSMSGCFINRAELSEILVQIESGSFDKQFELDGRPVKIGGAA